MRKSPSKSPSFLRRSSPLSFLNLGGFRGQIGSLASALLIMGAASDWVPVPAQAHPVLSNSAQAKQLRGSVPGRRRGGARRGDCPAASAELTALAPATEVATQTLPETYVGGRTAAEHPTFWFYVPYSLTADRTAEFILQDDVGQDIYRIPSANFLTSEQTPGIISISLPSTIVPLELGKIYQWYFKLNCKMEAPLYVQGGIERISLNPDLTRQLASATPEEQAKIYLKNNIWYDAVTSLAQVRQTSPNNPAIASAWIDLLRSLGLEDIARN
jgi:Domain of Unknown Function (DUF928)